MGLRRLGSIALALAFLAAPALGQTYNPQTRAQYVLTRSVPLAPISIACGSAATIALYGSSDFGLSIAGLPAGAAATWIESNNGSNFFPFPMLPISGGPAVTSTSSNGLFEGSTSIATTVQIAITGCSSGAATASLTLGSGSSVSNVLNPGSGGGSGSVAVSSLPPVTIASLPPVAFASPVPTPIPDSTLSPHPVQVIGSPTVVLSTTGLGSSAGLPFFVTTPPPVVIPSPYPIATNALGQAVVAAATTVPVAVQTLPGISVVTMPPAVISSLPPVTLTGPGTTSANPLFVNTPPPAVIPTPFAIATNALGQAVVAQATTVASSVSSDTTGKVNAPGTLGSNADSVQGAGASALPLLTGVLQFAQTIGNLTAASTSSTGTQPAGSVVTTSMIQNGVQATSVVATLNGPAVEAVAFEGSDDPLCTTSTTAVWYAVDATFLSSSSSATAAYTSATLTNPANAYSISRPGLTCVRIRATSFTSGSIAVRLSPSGAPATYAPYTSVTATLGNGSGTSQAIGTAATTLAVGTASAGPFLTSGNIGWTIQPTLFVNATATAAGTVSIQGSFDSATYTSLPASTNVAIAAGSNSLGQTVPSFRYYRIWSTVALTAVTAQVGGAY